MTVSVRSEQTAGVRSCKRVVECEGCQQWPVAVQSAQTVRDSRSDSHLARVYAGNPLAMSISSSQLMSHSVAAAGGLTVQCRVARVLVQIGEIGDWGRRMLRRFLGRRAHSKSWRSSRKLLGRLAWESLVVVVVFVGVVAGSLRWKAVVPG